MQGDILKREVNEMRESILQMRVLFEEQLQAQQSLLNSRVGQLHDRLSLQQSEHVETINAQNQFLIQKTNALRTAQATLQVFCVYTQCRAVLL